jgi:hypothetical protein
MKKQTKNSKTPKEDVLRIIDSLGENPTMMDIRKAIAKKVKQRPWKNPIPKWLFTIGGAFAFFTLLYFVISGLQYHGNINPESANKKMLLLDFLLYSFWTIAPPSYFFYEYMWIFPPKYKLNPGQMSDLKHVQDLASKIWAALLLGFGIILYFKYGVKP